MTSNDVDPDSDSDDAVQTSVTQTVDALEVVKTAELADTEELDAVQDDLLSWHWPPNGSPGSAASRPTYSVVDLGFDPANP